MNNVSIDSEGFYPTDPNLPMGFDDSHLKTVGGFTYKDPYSELQALGDFFGNQKDKLDNLLN